MPKTELLCFGNAVVDVFASVDSARMDGFGINAPVQHLAPEQVHGILGALGGYTRSSGGGAANAAKIAALLGIRAAFAGCTGSDETAAFFESGLRAAGVVPLLKKVQSPTGICLVLKSGEETRIAASPAAALELNAADINEKAARGAKMVVIDGYMLERRNLIERILHICEQAKIPAALDAASVFVARNHAADFLRWCKKIPFILFMNAGECIAFYRALTKNAPNENPPGGSDAEKEEIILRDICPLLREKSAGAFPVIVVKLGSRGALAAAGGEIYRAGTKTVTPKDSTGAGDAFCAAFLAARLRGKSIAECLALGNAVAGLTLEVHGTEIRAERLAIYARALNSKTD